MKRRDHKSSKAYNIDQHDKHQDNHVLSVRDAAVGSYDISDYYELEQSNANTDVSAIVLLSLKQKIIFLCLFVSVALGLIYNHQTTIFLLLIFFNSVYSVSCVFKYILFHKGMRLDRLKDNSHVIHQQSYCCEKEWPIYSIMVPVYKEAAVLPGLLDNLSKIHYPKNKLQILIVLESDDDSTIAMAQDLLKKYHFEMVIVPDCLPKTKPKACNYALRFVRGEYTVVYDADDKPCKNQLVDVVNLFWQSLSNVVCIQARLNYYNAKENLLTALFSVEYSMIFNYTLPALESLDLFIPLGGTSNHFKSNVLKNIKWDQYNLTEDADIGVRLKKYGYKVKNINSYTLEEAPITIKSWIKQRSRWHKGFIQTYFIHNQHLQLLRKKFNLLGLLSFNVFFIFGTIAAIGVIISPILIFYIDNAFINVITLVNFILFYSTELIKSYKILKINNLEKRRLIISCLFPFYLTLQIFPAIRSIFQLIKEPHYWEKTTHGVSKDIGIS